LRLWWSWRCSTKRAGWGKPPSRPIWRAPCSRAGQGSAQLYRPQSPRRPRTCAASLHMRYGCPRSVCSTSQRNRRHHPLRQLRDDRRKQIAACAQGRAVRSVRGLCCKLGRAPELKRCLTRLAALASITASSITIEFARRAFERPPSGLRNQDRHTGHSTSGFG